MQKGEYCLEIAVVELIQVIKWDTFKWEWQFQEWIQHEEKQVLWKSECYEKKC